MQEKRGEPKAVLNPSYISVNKISAQQEKQFDDIAKIEQSPVEIDISKCGAGQLLVIMKNDQHGRQYFQSI